MKSRPVSGMLLVLSGFVFLLLAYGATPRNNLYLGIGVVFVVLGSATLRRARRS